MKIEQIRQSYCNEHRVQFFWPTRYIATYCVVIGLVWTAVTVGQAQRASGTRLAATFYSSSSYQRH